MKFFAPSKVYIERECVRNHGEELAALGRKAMLVTGRHSALANGSQDDVTAVLDAAFIPYVIFNEVEENPSVETVAKAAALGIRENVDFIIGIGGGSPMDAAKAVAVLVANPREPAECLYESKPLKALPFAAVPTTCGTGSEVTPNAVLTRPALGKKGSMSHSVYSSLSLVDGKYLAGASRGLIVNTSVDALAHCLESFLSAKTNEYNRMFSEYGIKLWGSLIPYLTGGKDPDGEVYDRLMLTAAVAGMAIAQTGTSLPHALSYPLTLNHALPHGRACGLFLAAYMEIYSENKPEDIERILNLMGLKNLRAFDALMQRLLGRETLEEGERRQMAEDLAANPGKLSTFPWPIDTEGVRAIVDRALH